MFITNDIELAAAVEHMRAAGTDLAEYELKTAAGGFPKTMPDSISAFANGAGGTIVFGISEKDGFHSVGIDVKMIQRIAPKRRGNSLSLPRWSTSWFWSLSRSPSLWLMFPSSATGEAMLCQKARSTPWLIHKNGRWRPQDVILRNRSIYRKSISKRAQRCCCC